MTVNELASAIGVSPATIRSYEKGGASAYRHHIFRLSEALRFPIQFFTAHELDLLDRRAPNFRSMSSMRAAQRDTALAVGSLALDVDRYLRRQVRLPVADVPDLSGHTPDVAATMLRQHWGLGDKPIPNLVHLLESKGIRIFFLMEEAKEVDAFSVWRGGEVPLCLLNTYKSPEHGRFDAAHELGHLVLHRDDAVKVREREHEANAFASGFLMPASGLIPEVPQISSMQPLMALKLRWRVSLAAMVRRVYQLQLISQWQYENMCIAMARNGFLKSEPVPGIDREMSLVFDKTFKLLWQQGTTREDIARALYLPLVELDSLTNAGTATQLVRKPSRLSVVR